MLHKLKQERDEKHTKLPGATMRQTWLLSNFVPFVFHATARSMRAGMMRANGAGAGVEHCGATCGPGAPARRGAALAPRPSGTRLAAQVALTSAGHTRQDRDACNMSALCTMP